MASTLEELLQELEDAAKEAEGANGVDGSSGPLPEPRKAYVKERLDTMEDLIEQLRDSSKSPSLSPVNVGAPIGSYQPTDAAAHARDCSGLAHEALVEAQKQSPSHQYIGDRIATITDLIPGYATAVGI